MKRALLFDIDGVLIDSSFAHWLSWIGTWGDRGIPITEAVYAALGVPPESCVVIEESIHGLTGARAAGMGTVALVSTNTAEPHST